MDRDHTSRLSKRSASEIRCQTSMRSVSSLRVLHLLFFLRYVSIAATGFALVVANTLFIAKLLGFLHLVLLIAGSVGLLGNHTATSSAISLNACYLIWSAAAVPLLGVPFSDLGVPLILHLFWLPQVVHLVAVVVIPSVSIIVPGKLILGNVMAASSESTIMDYGVTHIVGIHLGDSNKGSDLSSVAGVEKVLQLKWNADEVGTTLREAISFINQAVQDTKDAVVLIYCPFAVCISPTVVVHWLVSSGHVPCVKAGYKLVRKARPVVDIERKYIRALERVNERKEG